MRELAPETRLLLQPQTPANAGWVVSGRDRKVREQGASPRSASECGAHAAGDAASKPAWHRIAPLPQSTRGCASSYKAIRAGVGMRADSCRMASCKLRGIGPYAIPIARRMVDDVSVPTWPPCESLPHALTMSKWPKKRANAGAGRDRIGAKAGTMIANGEGCDDPSTRHFLESSAECCIDVRYLESAHLDPHHRCR